jgi:phosphatidylserine synthase 2
MNEDKGEQLENKGSKPLKIDKDVSSSTIRPFLQEEFISMFYKPHSVTILIIAICAINYFAFLRRRFSLEENIKRGLFAMISIFLTFCLVQLRDGVMRRPHPAFWRLVTGVGILYLMALIFLLFLEKDDARKMFRYLYDDLGKKLPERSYADACAIYTPDDETSLFANVKATILDEFIWAHIIGYILKAIMFRDFKLCWILSLSFEIVEISLQHILENFKECWWDHVIIDVLVCNNLGIMIGLWLCQKFCVYNEYEWVGLDKIASTTGKLKRIAEQFMPYYWTSYRWEIFESWKRFLYFISLLTAMTLVDCNSFFLKYLFWIPPRNPLNSYRLILWFFIGMPAVREYYLYITDDSCKRLGTNTWLAIGIAAIETLIVFKNSAGEFTKIAPPHIWVNWLLVIFLFLPWFFSYFFVFGPKKVRANSILKWIHDVWLTLSIAPFIVLFLVGLPDLKLYQAEFDGAVDNWMARNGYNVNASWSPLSFT